MNNGLVPDAVGLRYVIMYHRNLEDVVEHESNVVGSGVAHAFSNE